MLGGPQGLFDSTQSITRSGASGDAHDALRRCEVRISAGPPSVTWCQYFFLVPSREIQQQYFKFSNSTSNSATVLQIQQQDFKFRNRTSNSATGLQIQQQYFKFSNSTSNSATVLQIQQQYFKLNNDHFLLQHPQYTSHQSFCLSNVQVRAASLNKQINKSNKLTCSY